MDTIGGINTQIVKLQLGADGVDGGLVDTANPLPFQQIYAGTLTDRSGTILSGGVAQTLMAANPARRYLWLLNHSPDTLWVNFGATAVAASPSIPVYPGDVLRQPDQGFLSTQAVSILGATTGQAFVAKEG